MKEKKKRREKENRVARVGIELMAAAPSQPAGLDVNR